MAKNLNILIIEDEIFQIKTFGMIFSRKGHQVHFASTGKAGLELLNSLQIDVVLMDLGLKDIDGIHLIPKIRDIRADQIILILTGDTSEQSEKLAQELRVDGYIQKPIAPDTLIKTVEVTVENR